MSNTNINFILEQYGDIADYYDMHTGYTYLISGWRKLGKHGPIMIVDQNNTIIGSVMPDAKYCK